MSVPNTPNELSELTDFECRLLAKRYPFMKIVQLPRGKQTGILGQVVNVPVDAESVCKALPRTASSSGICSVKLKRKSSYKGYVNYQNIRPEKVKKALHWLMHNNRHYQNDVIYDEHWENTFQNENEELWHCLTADFANNSDEISDGDNSSISMSTSDTEDESISPTNVTNENNEATKFDTCIQPTDPAGEASNILTLAPGEGRHPLHIMTDPSCEEQSFPQLFPTGCFGFDASREVNITPKKYFNARILNKDGKFARNVEYLFYSQYVTEHKQVMDNVSVALRKSHSSFSSCEPVAAGVIKNPEKLNSLILKDKAYNFLQTVRGSPPYWQRALYKLIAAVKQFGIFTFFMTLSSADLKWIDCLNAILRQQGRLLSSSEINDLTWEEKCTILRSNPVTAARHFDYRLSQFYKTVVCSEAKPLGNVLHYSYRIEFQKRGSPHAHCVLWIENAPSPDDDEKKIADFIDKYITCKIPSKEENAELHHLVTSVQIHHHTQTCRKKGTECRFGFSKLPSPKTIIAKAPENDNVVLANATVETAAHILADVHTKLSDTDLTNCSSLEDIVHSTGLTMDQYMFALGVTKQGKTVVLRRDISERNVNYYNKYLLQAWEANLDIQYCLDPYACIAYMLAYITKDEREMSTVLQNVSKESANCGWKEQMKACASAFFESSRSKRTRSCL
jgi:hypothetical protein